MRQRRLKNLEARITEHNRYLIDDPKEKKGNWPEVFGNRDPVFAEFGCGRGKFILEMAEHNPSCNYVAFECRSSIILRALEKAIVRNPHNLFFVNEHIIDIGEYFEENELSGIFLNFSDPWPKKRHEKRRLTHSGFLKRYKNILKPECSIDFKTDNNSLFSFTLNEAIKNNMAILESTDDLHSSQLSARLVTTEYEDKFRDMGKRISYCKIRTDK